MAVQTRMTGIANDACTAMRLGERMTNHVWGIFDVLYIARNAMGTVLYSNVRSTRKKHNFKEESKRNTDRKAKHKPIFIRDCIGFFCNAIIDDQARSPPSSRFFNRKIKMEVKRMLNDFRNRDFWTINKEDETTYHLRIKGKWVKVTKEVYTVYKNSYQKMYSEYQRSDNFIELTEYIESQYVQAIDPLDAIVLNDMKCVLYKAIKQLTEDEQLIVRVHFFQGLSERQMASMLGISKTAFHYKKMKILAKMKKLIDQSTV